MKILIIFAKIKSWKSSFKKKYTINIWIIDKNQQAPLKDPLHVSVGPITRARSKKIKEALNGLIQEIWA